MRRLVSLTLACILGALALSCTPSSSSKPRAKVAASVFPIYDLAKRIAGPDADVFLVLPRGANPASWTPPAAAAADAAGTTVVITVGLKLDPWMEAVVPSTTAKLRRLELGDRVPTITRGDGSLDPYEWMDPQRARLMVTAIAEELARADSSHAAAFRDRATAIDGAIASLDRETESQTAPLYGKAFVAANGGLNYYAERYKLHLVAAGAPVAGKPAPAVTDDALGANAAVRSYEDLIRENTAALESALH